MLNRASQKYASTQAEVYNTTRPMYAVPCSAQAAQENGIRQCLRHGAYVLDACVPEEGRERAAFHVFSHDANDIWLSM